MEWVDATGRASLYTWSVVHRNDLPPWKERVPYVAAVVELSEGPRMMTRLVDCTEPEIEMELEVDFIDHTDDQQVPVFRPAAADSPQRRSAAGDAPQGREAAR